MYPDSEGEGGHQYHFNRGHCKVQYQNLLLEREIIFLQHVFFLQFVKLPRRMLFSFFNVSPAAELRIRRKKFAVKKRTMKSLNALAEERVNRF